MIFTIKCFSASGSVLSVLAGGSGVWCLELGFTRSPFAYPYVASLHVSRSSVGTRCQMTT